MSFPTQNHNKQILVQWNKNLNDLDSRAVCILGQTKDQQMQILWVEGVDPKSMADPLRMVADAMDPTSTNNILDKTIRA